MLCCITFLLTSITTNAAEGDIVYTSNSRSWRTSSSDSSSVGSVFYGYLNTTWQFTISGNDFRSYSGNNFELELTNLYLPVEPEHNTNLNYPITTFSYDSNCGVFVNSNRVGDWAVPNTLTTDFSVGYDRVDMGNTYHEYYYFSYIPSFKVVVSKNDAYYLSSSDIYVYRISLVTYCNSVSYGIVGISNQYQGFKATTDVTWTGTFPLATCYFHSTSKQPSSTVTTNDSGTQNAINNQTDTIQEGNDIAQEGNDIAQDTNDKVTSFFGSFFDNLIGVFVPESGFFSQWFSDLNTFMGQKLGFLWSPFDFIISFLNGVYSSSGSSAQLVFPELAWIDGTVIIPRTVFSFDNIGGQSFQDLRDMIYFSTDVILLGAVVSQFYQKIKLVFEGGSD